MSKPDHIVIEATVSGCDTTVVADTASSSTPPAASADPVADLWREMKQRWAAGERPSADEYLPRLGPSPCEEHVVDIIYAEYSLREESGENPTARDYLVRFAQYASALQRQFALHEAILAPNAEVLTDAGDLTQTWRQPATSRCEGDQPTRIGKYLVLSRLGQGGQADVFRAFHPELQKEVVLKLARNAVVKNSVERERLLSEGRLLADLDEPALVKVFDFDFDAERPFLVLEHVQGQSLRQVVEAEKPSPRQAAVWMVQVARGVATFHRRGVLHRDIKPANILIDELQRPHIIDFGLATAWNAWSAPPSHGEQISGTLQFMPPEQARGEAGLDQRSDVFALGAVLYYLLTGRAPYPQKTVEEVLGSARRGDWDQAALESAPAPEKLKAICSQAMAATPSARFPSAEAFADALERYTASPFIQRRWLLAVGTAAAVLGLVGWGQGWFTASQTSADAPLEVGVWQSGRYVPLYDAIPLQTGDELEVRASVPAGHYVSLFLITSSGELKVLESYAPATEPWRLRYPQEEQKSVTLIGRPGTEFVLLCGSRRRAITLADVQSCCSAETTWPVLPSGAVLTLDRSGVQRESYGRDFGPPSDRPDPEAEIARRLQAFHKALLATCDLVSGIAFAHE